MTVENIFSDIASRMLKGLMFHDQLSQMFMFLGLDYEEKAQHEQYNRESENYREICRYYTTRTNRLMPKVRANSVEVIPELWYGYTRMDVSFNTRQQSVRDIYEKWMSWEVETKKIYEDAYRNLIELGEVALALHVCEYIRDVESELANLEKEYLRFKTVDFDMTYYVDFRKIERD